VDLTFQVEGVSRMPGAAVPTLVIALRIEVPANVDVRSVLLDTQIQIAARRRSYVGDDHDRLSELFGPPGDWSRNLQTLPWMRLTTVVPPFTATTVVELPLACTYDLEVSAARYFDSLTDGNVPLELLFSGTVFAAGGPGGMLRVERISWEQEAECALPVAVWRETLRSHFGDAAWLRLGKPGFDRLQGFKARRRLATIDDAVDALLALAEADEEARAWTTT
jgi:Family of unknown function (DUF6084)